MNLSGSSKRGVGVFSNYDISLESTPTSHAFSLSPIDVSIQLFYNAFLSCHALANAVAGNGACLP